MHFSQSFKIAMTHELPSEDVLMQLERKMHKDTEIMETAIETLRDMGNITQNIFEQELQINYTIGLIKEQQGLFTSYLVNYNNQRKGERENLIEEMEENFD